jgi:FtsH-binding integral membrane protein
MDLVKYLIAGGISLIVAVIAGVMGNVLSGVLIFVLLFGGYILFNITNVMRTDTPEVSNPLQNGTSNPSSSVPSKDN